MSLNKMRRCEDVRMWRCEDEKMWRWADVKMWRCEDEQMWRWKDVKMWRREDVLQTPTIGRTLRSDALGKNVPCGHSSAESGLRVFFHYGFSCATWSRKLTWQLIWYFARRILTEQKKQKTQKPGLALIWGSALTISKGECVQLQNSWVDRPAIVNTQLSINTRLIGMCSSRQIAALKKHWLTKKRESIAKRRWFLGVCYSFHLGASWSFRRRFLMSLHAHLDFD